MRVEHQTIQAPDGVPGDQDAPGGSATVKLSPRSPSPGDQGQVGVSQARQDEGFVNRGSDQSTNDSGGHPVKLERPGSPRFDSRQQHLRVEPRPTPWKPGRHQGWRLPPFQPGVRIGDL